MMNEKKKFTEESKKTQIDMMNEKKQNADNAEKAKKEETDMMNEKKEFAKKAK